MTEINSADHTVTEQQVSEQHDENPPIEVETNRGGTVTRIEIPLVGNGTDDESNAALATLRNDLLPGTLGQLDGVEYAVTGQTANSQDFNESQTSSAPKVFGFVLLFAFALLLVSFRSIVIAVKAILLNLLSVGAAYGLLVLVFQHGVGADLLGLQQVERVEAWVPIFLFSVLFALSMFLHARGGAAEQSLERVMNGEPPIGWLAYMGTAQFWFESLQNWQSEFVSIVAIVGFSIFLRQQGSPQSKPVDESNDETGT